MNTKKTVLIVDDTETNIDLLLELLTDDYDIVVALNGPSALEIASEEKIDLILLDIMMPEMNGFEVCTLLKMKENTKDIPIIFLTAKNDEDTIEKAYEVGGVDYISKPFKPRELLVRIKTQIRLSGLLEHLEYIASYDVMTGIYNRRKFFSEAEKMFEKSGENLYAVMIDIDKFKAINDTYSHSIGDEVIKLVTAAISQHLLGDGLLGRIGGEEFAIVCRNSSKEKIIENVEVIRSLIEKLEVVTSDNSSVTFTISEGIAQSSPSVNTLDLLLKAADKALYEAKGSGRNKVIFR